MHTYKFGRQTWKSWRAKRDGGKLADRFVPEEAARTQPSPTPEEAAHGPLPAVVSSER